MPVDHHLQTKRSIEAVVACSNPKNLPFNTDSILNHLHCIHCGKATSAVTPRNSSDVMMSGLFAMCEWCNPINEWIVCICCLQTLSQHLSYKRYLEYFISDDKRDIGAIHQDSALICMHHKFQYCKMILLWSRTSQFYKDCIPYLKPLKVHDKSIILAGDFNEVLDSGNSNMSKVYQEIGLVDIMAM
jgi:hypothetical protein